ncbi:MULTISPECIES: ribosomal protein S18-alanine N-acetyltransferase [unclassified Enterococcus]|uniref:ribosomal protein S18-alanine N-acetyltransferase n=1 Tax=unclassified Enterococcus TaxID=2608891 RepID=UPI0006BA0690|nr:MULTISPECIES: ribosomal protein S18-alanine N-acetyltransferase [unclassified Enterococcus]KPG69353.1 alanine acetyltransferase [Enterococcus sp. RIT-PI-f]HCE11829.1 ribosomal-protein-alanine N-acetyltransferase [Enterococcus sp.]
MLKKFKAIKGKLTLFRHIQYPERTVDLRGNTYVLRELVGDDIKELLQVERLVYAGELPWTKSAFLSELYSRVKHLYIGVLYQERMIGFAGVRILGGDAHITNIAIIPEYQGKGLGSFLLAELEQYARKQTCDRLTLEVRLSNRDAQRLYRQLGFQSQAIKTAYYTEGNEDALDMVKFIDG